MMFVDAVDHVDSELDAVGYDFTGVGRLQDSNQFGMFREDCWSRLRICWQRLALPVVIENPTLSSFKEVTGPVGPH